MTDSALLARVEEELTSFGVIRGERLLIALSGGVDSMALAMILHELVPAWGFELFAAHLNHGIRPPEQGQQEWELIQDQCSHVFKDIFYKSIEPGWLVSKACQSKLSLEEVARQSRYDFFDHCLERCQARFMLLGHHRDDQEETLIMRFFQGASPAGLKGISSKRGKKLRPLLWCPKKDLKDFLDSRSLVYSFDTTNDDLSILRNSIRHKIVPELQETFPGMSRALSRFSWFMSEMTEFIEGEAEERLFWQEVPEGWAVPRELWNRQPFLIKLQSLWKLRARVVQGDSDEKLPFAFFNPLKEECLGRKNRILLKGYGFELKLRDDQIIFRSDLVLNRKKGYFIYVKPGLELKLKDLNVQISPNNTELSNICYEAGSLCYLDFRGGEEIILRNRKIGDKIELKNGSKSLKKLYNEWKIPDNERWLIPVLEDSEGLLALLGKSFGYADIFSQTYKVRFHKQSGYVLKIFKDGVILK